METRNLEKTAAAASSEEIQPLTLTRKTGKSCTYLYIKRMQDIVLSALALLLLSPLMLLLALAVVISFISFSTAASSSIVTENGRSTS